MNNILVTNSGGSGKNVLIYTKLTAKIIGFALIQNGFAFDEVINVYDEEVQHTCIDERLWADLETEAGSKKQAESFILENPRGSEGYVNAIKKIG